jgi:hypothetical protein
MSALGDTQKEAFRKYLESAGVIDALTKGEAHASRAFPLPAGAD